jgi:catechol-2,3-dioxygenase
MALPSGSSINKHVEIQNGREPLMSEAGLFHIGILLPTLTTLADLLVHLSDFEVPVNGGQQSGNIHSNSAFFLINP